MAIKLNKDEQAAIDKIMGTNSATPTVAESKDDWTLAILGAGIGYTYAAFNHKDKSLGVFIGAIAGYIISKYVIK